MEAATRLVNSLTVPLAEQVLLLPQAAIAEVVRPEALRQLEHGAPWLRGVFDWRTEQIPLVSLEWMCGQEIDSEGVNRFVVLYALEQIPGLAYYAVEARGIPRSMRIDSRGLLPGEVDRFECDIVQSHVLVDGEHAFIPNLAVIERSIRAQLQRL
jgi:chemosensory pili system protein ChpC